MDLFLYKIGDTTAIERNNDYLITMATITNKQLSKPIRISDLSNTKIGLLYVGTLVASVTLSIVGLSALAWVAKIL